MKNLWSTALIMLTTVIFTHPSHAETEVLSLEEPVSANQLKIIGRGIENKETHDVIALACVGEELPDTREPSCRVLRNVKLKADSHELSFVGGKFDVNWELDIKGEPTQKDLIRLVRRLNKNAIKYKKKMNRVRNGKFISRFAAISFGAFGATVITKSMILTAMGGAAIPTGPALLAALGLMIIVCGVQAIVLDPVFPNSSVISKVMADQNGWNWSIKPKKISARTFHWFERYLDHV